MSSIYPVFGFPLINGTAKSTNWKVIFSLLMITWSSLLTWFGWPIFMSKSQRILCLRFWSVLIPLFCMAKIWLFAQFPVDQFLSIKHIFQWNFSETSFLIRYKSLLTYFIECPPYLQISYLWDEFSVLKKSERIRFGNHGEFCTCTVLYFSQKWGWKTFINRYWQIRIGTDRSKFFLDIIIDYINCSAVHMRFSRTPCKQKEYKVSII